LQKEEIRKRVSENSTINKTKLAEEYGVSRETLYRVISEKD
jgi:DNA-binding phage protein